MKLKLYTVNAFADAPFTGNPAAVCPLESWLDVSVLQAIAAQNNLAETAYLVFEDPGCFRIRWFTPATEVPLCGHATLASAFALRTCLGEAGERLVFQSASGPLAVSCQGETYTLDFPVRPPRPAAVPSWFVEAFGANPSEYHQADYGLAIFPSQEIVAALEPNFAYLAKLPGSNVIVSAPGERHDFVSRFFAPNAGIDEDPVTGSAHCTLAPYWARRLGKQELAARQISKRGGELRCALNEDRVLISGQAQLYSVADIFV